MSRLFVILACVTGLAIKNQTVANAEEPVTPPATLPQESWSMTFDNYQTIGIGEIPSLSNSKRDVSVVRNGDDLYIKGIFHDYPNIWIKGEIRGNEFTMDKIQLMSTDCNEPLYFYFGSAFYHISNGNTFAWRIIDFKIQKENNYDVIFTVSDDGNTISASKQTLGYENRYACAFWFGDRKSDRVEFEDGWRIDYFGEIVEQSSFPKIDYIINMVFKKNDGSGIEQSVQDVIDDEMAPTYDLQGRRVNPETAAPGIYIHNRKKIIL